jgi:hypothetical protein
MTANALAHDAACRRRFESSARYGTAGCLSDLDIRPGRLVIEGGIPNCAWNPSWFMNTDSN